jgi:hypothetical protein
MTLQLVNLDQTIRALMLEEMAFDLAQNQLHISPYLSGQGVHDYPNLLREAIEHGDEDTLAESLRAQRRIERTGHRRKTSGGYTIVTVPDNAADMLAQDAFNRY